MMKLYKTLSVRIKDKHSKILERMAFDVNQVWNAANQECIELSWVPIPEVGFMNCGTSAFELMKDLKGIRKERGMIIIAGTVEATIAKHYQARKTHKKNRLKWRKSFGTKRSLGWIPFKARDTKLVDGKIRYFGNHFDVWDSYDLSKYEFKSGCFSEDSRGRWYFNICVEESPSASIRPIAEVGIDLGLSKTAACSNGQSFSRKDFYRNNEKRLAVAQRAKKKKRASAIHAKIKNCRRDAIHKFTTTLVKNNGLIVIGKLNSNTLAKTKMAKSVYDAGWHMIKTQLDYKSIAAQVLFVEVNESYTTQACSCCGEISANSPKGRAGLRIREWDCAGCGALHDRDINAAKNILALGHERLAAGISA